MLNKAVDLTIFGIAISFLLLTILIFFIAIIKYFDKKLNNSKGEKQTDNDLISKFAPKIVKGTNKLKKWSESI